MSFKINDRYRKFIKVFLVIFSIPLLAVVFRYLYCFGIIIGENWRILCENLFFS